MLPLEYSLEITNRRTCTGLHPRAEVSAGWVECGEMPQAHNINGRKCQP